MVLEGFYCRVIVESGGGVVVISFECVDGFF